MNLMILKYKQLNLYAGKDLCEKISIKPSINVLKTMPLKQNKKQFKKFLKETHVRYVSFFTLLVMLGTMNLLTLLT